MTKLVSTPDGFIHPDRIVRIEPPTDDGLYIVHYIDEHGQAKRTRSSVYPHEWFELP